MKFKKIYMRHPFLECLIMFLVFSIIIGMLIFAIQHHFFPFARNINFPTNQRLWFYTGIIIGIILPILWLIIDWDLRELRFAISAFILMQLLQILTEFGVSVYFFPTLVIPVAILYVSHRIFQVLRMQQMLQTFVFKDKIFKTVRMFLVQLNLLFWFAYWIKLTVIMLPNLITS